MYEKIIKTYRDYIKLDNFTDVSRLDGFTLDMYILTKEKICYEEHKQPCSGMYWIVKCCKADP